MLINNISFVSVHYNKSAFFSPEVLILFDLPSYFSRKELQDQPVIGQSQTHYQQRNMLPDYR